MDLKNFVAIQPIGAVEQHGPHLPLNVDYKIVDGLITNFHSPESTLLMLISAFADYDFIKLAYREEKKKKYRFLSYGDSMFIM